MPWFAENKRSFPWRSQRSAYRTWVCEIMSQQTLLRVVVPKFEAFVAELPTPAHLAAVEEAVLRRLWAGLGYYARARNLQKGARALIARHGAEGFPSSYEEWLEIPGVGPYTASVLSSLHCDEARACVDGNVIRVVSRLLGLGAEVWSKAGQDVIQRFADRAICRSDPGAFNEAMMELGASVCRPVNPLCERCPVAERCVARERGITASCPPPKPRKETKDTPLTLLILSTASGEQAALFERNNGFLAGTVGWPLLTGSFPVSTATLGQEFARLGIHLLGTPARVRHTITHHRLSLSIAHAEVPDALWASALRIAQNACAALGIDCRPHGNVPLDVADALSSSLDRKAWNALLGSGRVSKSPAVSLLCHAEVTS